MGVRKPWKGCTMAEMEIDNKYIRNWSEYNEHLVRRGEMYIDLDSIENWDEELEQQNRGKKGRPYIYPEAFIRFSAWYTMFSGFRSDRWKAFTEDSANT